MSESLSLNSSIPQLNLDDQPQSAGEGIGYAVIDGNSLFRRLGGFNDIKGFKAKSLGLTTGNEMFNALDSSKYDITTSEILRVHFLRILLTLMLFIHMNGVQLYQVIEDWIELIHIFWFDLWSVSKLDSEAMTFGIYFINNISCGAVFTKNLVYNIPSVFLRLVNNAYLGNNPSSGLINFKLSIPQDFLPVSISLVLEVNQDVVSPPPSIPQPYLNADKKITVPSKREIQQVLSLRNEYFTHQSVYLAAEKVRIQSEIARFVTWCALIPSLTHINVFERFGFVWDIEVDQIEHNLEILGNSILNELSSFANSCYVYELDELRALIPRITLVEVISGKSYTINQISFQQQQQQQLQKLPIIHDDGIESLISSYTDDRELIVKLCDSRIKVDSIANFLRTIDKDEIDVEYDFFQHLNEVILSTPDLIIVPGKNNAKQTKLFGYTSLVNVEQVGNSNPLPVLYFSKTRFGFPFFIRSLYYYALNNDVSEAELVNFVNSASLRQTLQQQQQHHHHHHHYQWFERLPEEIIPGHYLINFFKRLRNLRLFDLNSSPVRPNEYGNENENGNEANLLLSSSELLTTNV